MPFFKQTVKDRILSQSKVIVSFHITIFGLVFNKNLYYTYHNDQGNIVI